LATTDPKVMEFVERELEKNPDVSATDLHEKAKKKFDGLKDLTVRQFHARYPLQVKRRKAPKRGAKKKRSRKTTREAATPATPAGEVRDILLRLVRDVADAEGKADIVDVVAGVDGYVDKILKATK